MPVRGNRLIEKRSKDQIKGHKGKFIQLLEQNKGIIHKISMMHTSNVVDKEDLYQEICLQLWRSYRTYCAESKFSTGLYRVVPGCTWLYRVI